MAKTQQEMPKADRIARIRCANEVGWSIEEDYCEEHDVFFPTSQVICRRCEKEDYEYSELLFAELEQELEGE
jgi:hypothetical protein